MEGQGRGRESVGERDRGKQKPETDPESALSRRHKRFLRGEIEQEAADPSALTAGESVGGGAWGLSLGGFRGLVKTCGFGSR